MLLNEKINDLQNLTKKKITYEQVAKILGLGSKQAAQNRVTRKQELKEWEIIALDDAFLNKKVNNDNQDTVQITYRPDVFLSAGYGVEVLDETKETMTLDARLLTTERGCRINPQHCEIVSVSGNSMAPEYRHGDKVIIDRGDTELVDGHIFAFRYNGQCYVKEINLLGDKIKCISLNKEYDPFYINKGEQFTVLGRIIPRIRL